MSQPADTQNLIVEKRITTLINTLKNAEYNARFYVLLRQALRIQAQLTGANLDVMDLSNINGPTITKRKSIKKNLDDIDTALAPAPAAWLLKYSREDYISHQITIIHEKLYAIEETLTGKYLCNRFFDKIYPAEYTIPALLVSAVAIGLIAGTGGAGLALVAIIAACTVLYAAAKDYQNYKAVMQLSNNPGKNQGPAAGVSNV